MNDKYQSSCLWTNRQLHIKSVLNQQFHKCCTNRTIFSFHLQIERCKTSSGLVAIRHLSYKLYFRFINAIKYPNVGNQPFLVDLSALVQKKSMLMHA